VTRFVARRALFALALTFVTVSVAIAASGGFSASLPGVRLSAHSPLPSAAAAIAAFVLWFLAAQRSRAITIDLVAAASWIERHGSAVVLVIAGLAGAVAVRFGTFSASGSDPSGYLSLAAMLGARTLAHLEPLAAIATWPDGAATLAPLGWRAVGDSLQVPTYAVGLPLLLAIPHAVGGPLLAVSLVAGGSAFATVWFGARIATMLGGSLAGIIAAAWIATLPVEIYESIQPMSDVPVTAAWLACWYWIAVSLKTGRVPISAGIAAAVAVLIRPNLAPLAAIPLLYVAVGRPALPLRVRVTAVLGFALPVAAAGTTIAYLQWRWFGSPLRSGYGSASEIYALANVIPNVQLYLRWLLETHGPWLLAAPLALFVIGASILRWMLLFALLVCMAYLLYGQFEAWAYLRFLLPAMTIAAIAVSAVVEAVLRKVPAACRAFGLIAIVLGIAGTHVASARELSVFRLAARQSRAVLAGQYLAAALPAKAVLITGEQSGAMRYYTGRSIVRWDSLAREALPHVQQHLTAHGEELWLVLDDWEVGKFREKFQGAAAGAEAAGAGLDWPPIVDAGSDGRTQAWRLADRVRFLTGELVHGDRLR
jgi:hypothetical protein